MVDWFKKKARDVPEVIKPTRTEIARARGVVGAIDSYGKRKATERLQAEADAETSLYDSATSLNDAKGRFAASKVRNNRENLEKVGRAEHLKVDTELSEAEIRNARVNAEKARLNTELTSENRDAETKDLLSRARYQAEYEKLYGEKPKAKKDHSPKKQRKKLQKGIDKIDAELKELATAYAAKLDAGEMTEEYNADFNRRNNELLNKREDLEAKLAKL